MRSKLSSDPFQLILFESEVHTPFLQSANNKIKTTIMPSLDFQWHKSPSILPIYINSTMISVHKEPGLWVWKGGCG